MIQGYYQFLGKKYSETATSLGQFPVDSTGQLDAKFKIPEDYGGVHEITARIDGKTVAQNGVNVTQTFEFSPTFGPGGTPVEVKVKGLGWRTMESTWVVNWDNNVLVGIRRGNARIGRRTLSRDWSSRGSHGEALHRLAGTELS